MNTPDDLTALVGSRICHDLISPLGAIGNGVELIEMAGLAGGPEMELIADSVGHANARIRYFRVAFGAAQPGQAIAAGEIAAILKDMGQQGRFRVDWQPQGGLARKQVKLVLLLLQCIETAMTRGGHVTVSQVGGEWALTGEAESLSIDPELWAMLDGGERAPGLDAATVHFALAPRTAARIDRRVSVELSDRMVRIRF